MNDNVAVVMELLHRWLTRQLSDAAARWLAEKLGELQSKPTDRTLFFAISLVPRKIGKDDLTLDNADFADAHHARRGWTPVGWSVDQAARLLLLLSAGGSDEQFARRLEQLCLTADVGELVTFYRGLPLYPAQQQYVRRAAEGVRTNMKAVFEAVAHHNPYPAEQLDEGAWNQMVLKALFIGSRLQPIVGLDRRSNPTLMRMLCDYAHERWAAHRDVSPELWRCVGPHADDAALADLERVLNEGSEREREASVLALSACPHPRGPTLLATVPELVARVKRGQLSWDILGGPTP
ncbi:MAG: EboA domain-containing protein [Rhodothermales bacterium]